MKFGRYRGHMMNIAKHQNKSDAFGNLGDAIQVIVMDCIYKKIGIHPQDFFYMNREDDFQGLTSDEVIVPLHMGLMAENLRRMPLPDNYRPIFTSITLYYDFLAHAPKTREYFRKYQPVGCRDENTRKILRKYGIHAYLMGCFTICLPKREKDPVDGKVFLVDTPESLNAFLPKELLSGAEYRTHVAPLEKYPVTVDEDLRLEKLAEKLLTEYRDKAKLVITTRLHAALPCLGMGIPVILVRENYDSRFGFVDKFLPLYRMDRLDQIDWHPKSIDVEWVKDKIIDSVRLGIERNKDRETVLAELDEFYMSREKAPLNSNIREKVRSALEQFEGEPFSCAIWGAGAYGRYTYELIEEEFPQIHVCVFFDKYVRESVDNVSVVGGENFHDYPVDFVFVATRPGTLDALAMIKDKWGNQYEQHYAIVASPIKS